MVPSDRDAFRALTAERPGYDAERAEARTRVIWHIAFENPTDDGAPRYFVACDRDRIVCHMGRMPTWFWLRGSPHLASFAHDLFAHPELQASGRGFFVTMKLYKTVEEACRSFCGLCWTNDINIKFQQARKYDQLWTRPWVRALDVDRQVDRLHLPTPVASVAKLAGKLALGGIDELCHRALAASVTQLAGADERFDELDHRVGPRLGVAPRKTRAYVHWKYFSWPGLRTAVLALPDGPHLRGVIVLREPESPDESGRILDLMTDPDDTFCTTALLAGALKHFRGRALRRVECVATSPHLARALKLLLFLPRPPALPLFFLNAHKLEGADHLRTLEHWHHVFGDSEGGEVP